MADQKPRRGLTDEERAQADAEIAEWLRERDAIPESERYSVEPPERFMGPIGVDNEGNIVTETPEDPEDPEDPRQS
jgi:hypothetical protein